MSYFGIGVYHPKTEVNIGTLMRSAYSFGASYVYTIGRRYRRQASDTVKCQNQIPLYHYQTLDELLKNMPVGCRLIGVELAEAARQVGQYAHPQQCVYLLGAEDYGIPPKDLRRCHEVIQIPHATHCLNVAVAGSIVLFDRKNYLKWAA